MASGFLFLNFSGFLVAGPSSPLQAGVFTCLLLPLSDQVPDEVGSHTSLIHLFPYAFRKAVFIVRSLEYTNLPLLSPEVHIDDFKTALPLLAIASVLPPYTASHPINSYLGTASFSFILLCLSPTCLPAPRSSPQASG